MTVTLALDGLTAIALLAGLGFFMAGTVGVLRFPDIYTRLHAVTKVDNLGLGLVVLALALQTGSPLRIVKLGVIWALVVLAGSTAAQLIAQRALAAGIEPWERR
jgi:multicomponent Na+:H+ antiporter subunit G